MGLTEAVENEIAKLEQSIREWDTIAACSHGGAREVAICERHYEQARLDALRKTYGVGN